MLGAALVVSCGSSEVATTISAEERFLKGKRLYESGDYLDAINEFKIVTLQYPGSEFADDAQYFMGESYYRREQYLLASFEYQLLKRNMPASPLIPDAQYRIGLCYYSLSPRSRLDQQYTLKAIDELQTFVEYYPGNERAVDAGEKIRELTTRLAKKQYETAQLYATMRYYRASLLSYDDVIERYHDTEYAPLSYLGKVEVLITREKYQDASAELKKFYERYPNSVLRARADRLREIVEAELRKAPADPGTKTTTGESGGRQEGISSTSRSRD